MGRFDVTTKHLIEGHPRDWLALSGLPVTPQSRVSVVDADLSVMTTAADKVIRVDDGGSGYIAHVEFQSGSDPDLDQRILVYHVLAGWRHRAPVCSVVFLLRPEAESAHSTGRFLGAAGGRSRIGFEYELVRVWQLPVESILTGGIGSLPLAPICNIPTGGLPAVVDRMRQRFEAETTPAESLELWTAAGILMGLRFDSGTIRSLLKGVANMEESVTYQEIIEKGIDRGRIQGLTQGLNQGRVEGELRTLIRLGTQRFGRPDPAVLARLNAITDLAELDRLSLLLLTASGWGELLG